MVTGSDPNTNSFVRVWGAPSRTARRKEKGRAYLVDARRRQRAGRMAPSLAQSSPPVEETRGMRDREGEGRGREGPRAVNERSSSGPAMVLCIGGPMTHIYEP